MFLRQEGSSKNDPDYNIYVDIRDKVDTLDKSAHRTNTCGPFHIIHLGIRQGTASYQFGCGALALIAMLAIKDLGYKLGTKDFATGLPGRGKTASRPSPPFLPPISREPNGYTEQLNHTEPPTQAVSPSLVAPATTRPDLSLTSIYDGPDSQLDQESELQEPPPKEEPGQHTLWDQLAADLQTGNGLDSSNSFNGKDPGDRTGIRSLGDGNCLPPPEPTSPQARVDLYAATAGENTDRASSYDGPDSQLDRKSELQEPPPKDKTDRTNTKPGIKFSCKDLATGLFRQGRTNMAIN